MMGGSTDKLMSNHVYEVGIALHIAEGFGLCGRWFSARGFVAYSIAMVASRGHYTVDVVLAWWCLAAVGRLWRRHYRM